ncbi:MAG: hypothetical protein JWO99_341 [Candidatus Saccharibacteria bacterium]|nr:hypothetical protein [Candidatus Saccharibacteria bacterium]
MTNGEMTYTQSFFIEEDLEVIHVEPLSPELQVPADYIPEVLPNTGEVIQVTVDKEHAYPILDELLRAYANNEAPYNLDRVRLPHDPRHMPETLEYGSRDHAMFLFNVCYYMRGGIKSNDAVKRMSAVYDDHPALFDPEYVRGLSMSEDMEGILNQEIQGVLKAHGLGFQATVAGQWIENSWRMKEYEDDPRNIFNGVTTYEQSQELIQNKKNKGFIGFQEKMTSMIIYYLMDEDLIEPFNFPIPVDLHVMRVSIANEMVGFSDSEGNPLPYGTNLFTKETLAALRGLYLDYAEERNVNPLRLCDAVWMLSESSCGRHPGNTTIEPLGRKIRNGRKTYLIPKLVDVENPGQQKAYAESCAICPVQDTCEFNIPGTQYYVGGNIIIRGRRVRFPISDVVAPIEPLF